MFIIGRDPLHILSLSVLFFFQFDFWNIISLDFLVYFSHRLTYCGNFEHFVCKVDTNPLPLTPYTLTPDSPPPPLPPYG